LSQEEIGGEGYTESAIDAVAVGKQLNVVGGK